MKSSKIFNYSILAALALVLGISTVYATGTLTPAGTAGDDTHYSLKDVYNKLIDFSDNPDAISSPFAVPGSVAASFPTLTEIYNLLIAEDSDLVSANIVDGVTIFGVPGTATVADLSLTWAPVGESPNSLCWDSNQTDDVNSNGIWESGDLCMPDHGETADGYGAVEYCQHLEADGETLNAVAQNVWHLPTIAELFSITDYTIASPATLEAGFVESDIYWSGTPGVSAPTFSLFWSSEDGSFQFGDQSYSYQTRCVR